MTESISLKDVYNQILEIKQNMVSKAELSSFVETMEILHNADTMEQVRKSDEDIRLGRKKKINSANELWDE